MSSGLAWRTGHLVGQTGRAALLNSDLAWTVRLVSTRGPYPHQRWDVCDLTKTDGARPARAA